MSHRRPIALDLLIATTFVVWFYRPFLRPGLPYGDFPATVAISEVERDLVATPFALPTWNPYLMCGRPAVGFMSPFRALTLPFRGLEPIARMKAVLVLFHVLGALSMYVLVRRSGGGGDGSLFAAMTYPIFPEHVARTALHGHVQLPMFWALLPLAFLALFALRPAPSSVARLALVLALLLFRDVQRTLLLLLLLGLLLAPLALVLRRYRPILLLLLVAAGAAVAINSFELVNLHFDAASRAGHDPELQAAQLEHYALTEVTSFLDRGGRLFHDSPSRYLGLSLCALLLIGCVAPRLLGPDRPRFLFVLALLPLSVWLSFGPRPLAAPPVAIAAIAALASLVVYRNLDPAPPRHRLLLAIALALPGTALVLFTAPLPALLRFVFFLRDFRNPEWFSIAVASFATAVPAALVVGALARRFAGAHWWPLAFASVLALALLDLGQARSQLRHQRSPDYVAQLATGYRRIAEDPGDFRVLAIEGNIPLGDLGYIWHRKPLAWDFRDYTAPRATAALFREIFAAFRRGETAEAAQRAGGAGVKYLVDVRDAPPDIAAGDQGGDRLEIVTSNPAVTVYRNRRFRPLARGEGVAITWNRPAPERIVLSVDSAVDGARIVVAESDHPLWSASCDGKPVTIESGDLVFLAVRTPAGRHRIELRFERPRSYWGWGVLSLGTLAATIVLASGGARRAGDA